jgi:hypothetical protein
MFALTTSPKKLSSHYRQRSRREGYEPEPVMDQRWTPKPRGKRE